MDVASLQELLAAMAANGFLKIVVRGEDEEVKELVVIARGSTAVEFLPRVENFEALLSEDSSYQAQSGSFTVEETTEEFHVVEGDGSQN